MQFARSALGEGSAGAPNVLVRLAWEIGGAVAFGSLVGALFALYLRYVGREITSSSSRCARCSARSGATQGLEPLIAAMAAGLVIENLAVAQGDALKVAIQVGALPVLVVFFVAVGTSLRLDVLAAFGLVVAGLAAARMAHDSSRCLRLGVKYVGHRASRSPDTSGPVSSRRPASRWG